MKAPLYSLPIFFFASIINASEEGLINNQDEETNLKEEVVHELSDFVVTSEDDQGYFSANTTSVTRANELVKNTPVNVSVINEELLQDLGIDTTEDLAQVSASIDTDPTSYSLDQISIRGFRNTWTRFNGFRRNLARDGYNIARYDIIKGANSLIYGEASPGGSVNAIPKVANFRNDSGSFLYGMGNKNFEKFVTDYNKVISDKLAVRLMSVDSYRGYEHAYKNNEIRARTLSVNYRPDYKSSFQLHFEKVNSTFRFPTLAIKDSTFIDDADNAIGRNMATNPPKGYDGYLSVSEYSNQRRDMHVLHEGTWVKYAPQAFIDKLIAHTVLNISPASQNVNTGIDIGSGMRITGRQDLIDYYSDVNESNYGYQSGPDKGKTVSGQFSTLDYQRILNDELELSLSFNYQTNHGENLARDHNGIGKLIDSYSNDGKSNANGIAIYPRQHRHVYYPMDDDGNYYVPEEDLSPSKFFRTYWTKNEGDATRMGVKSTILWEKDIGKTSNKFLFGWNLFSTDKSETKYDQVPMDATNNDGSYLSPQTTDIVERADWVTNSKITDSARAYEYISLDKGFSADRSIIRFNEDIESDFLWRVNGNGVLTGDTSFVRGNDPITGEETFTPNGSLFGNNGVRDIKATWAENRFVTAKIKTASQWFGAQSKFLDGRVRTLVGLKYDTVKVDSTYRKISIFGTEGTNITQTVDGITTAVPEEILNNAVSEKYKELSPSLGGLFWINQNIGVFANYAESMQTPRGNAEDRTPVGTLAPPEIGKGKEIGIRFNNENLKIDGQLAYYSIKKENDNEFKYSNKHLNLIYPYDEYKDTAMSYIYTSNPNPSNTAFVPQIINSLLPGRRAIGDVTISEGIEFDINYNPTREITFIASINHTLKNEILKIHERVSGTAFYDNHDHKLFGRPDWRASLTGKYNFRSGKLKGFSFGISQHFRSSSGQTRLERETDIYSVNPDPSDTTFVPQVIDTQFDYYYPKYKDEFNTIAFANYRGKIGSGRDSLRYVLNFRVNNLFDERAFINRKQIGFYRESRSYNISAKILF